MPLSSLPTEIYAAIIDQLDGPDIRQTLLSLIRAIPSSPVPHHQIFRRIQISSSAQLVSFYQRIRRCEQGSDEAYKWVQEFSLETWTADAEIVLNVLSLLVNLSALTIWIGPKNFSPEHLEELFSVDRKGRSLKCIESLHYLALRFRPYVQKATYHQFLSGSYFDPTLEALSRWPAGSLASFSIVQDPLTNESGTSEGSEVSPPGTFSLGLPQRTLAAGFAQPIVFFSLEATCPGLLRSPYFRLPLKALRLRFPSRNIVQPLIQAPVPRPPSYGATIPAGSKPSEKYFRPVANAHLSPIPYLKFLDLSTCLVNEGSLPYILAQYPSLTHIVLDDCSILRMGDVSMRDNCREWGTFAMRCSAAGMGKAKEREKKVNAWIDALKSQEQRIGSTGIKKEPKRARGRKGLATATLSLRKEDTTPTLPSGSSFVQSTVQTSRIRILPPFPALRHLTATLYIPHSLVHPDTSGTQPQIDHSSLLKGIDREWGRGWAEGLSQLVKARARLHASWRNKLVRVMRFPTPDELASSRMGTLDSRTESDETGHVADPLVDLIEVENESEFGLDAEGGHFGNPPVLCLAGTYRVLDSLEASHTGTVAIRGLSHTTGCAHDAGRRLLEDGLL